MKNRVFPKEQKTRYLMLPLVLATLSVFVFTLAPPAQAESMGTAFTYQGRLYDTNHVADDFYDFEFELYDDPNTGLPQGSPVYKATRVITGATGPTLTSSTAWTGPT
jgi:hypothetical protein